MQPVIVAKPYEFIPPRYSPFWHRLLRTFLPHLIRKDHGIARIRCHGIEKLRASLDAGHGVMIAPNHCRPCDPMVMDALAAESGRPFHIIASWHVFMMNRLQRFLLPRVGGFSVYREGLDRESLKCATNLLTEARHPLVVFPEGIITRSNDRLAEFMDGTAFIARAAAKQKKDGKVVVHPVFIRYFHQGDTEKSLLPVLADIEKRLSWQPQSRLPLRDRIQKIGSALLGLKETEYFGSPRTGTIPERLDALENRILTPLEDRWTPGRHDGGTISRIKRLRTAIVPEVISGNPDPSDHWRAFADLYLSQQLHCYPRGYFENPTPERLLETIERFEEDLTDKARPHFPIHAVIEVGDAIEVSAEKERSPEGDPLTARIRTALESLLQSSKSLRP